MILYMESSGFLSVYLREPDRQHAVQDRLEQATVTFTSPLSQVEVRAGLARARFKENPPRLRQSGYARALNDFSSDWASVWQVDLDSELLASAAQIAEKHRLRAYDAVHLASAITVRIRSRDEILISTWDRELAAAAEAEGLSLAHEVTN